MTSRRDSYKKVKPVLHDLKFNAASQPVNIYTCHFNLTNLNLSCKVADNIEQAKQSLKEKVLRTEGTPQQILTLHTTALVYSEMLERVDAEKQASYDPGTIDAFKTMLDNVKNALTPLIKPHKRERLSKHVKNAFPVQDV